MKPFFRYFFFCLTDVYKDREMTGGEPKRKGKVEFYAEIRDRVRRIRTGGLGFGVCFPGVALLLT